MPNFRSLFVVICASMAVAVSSTAQSLQPVETVLQTRAVIQVKGVVHDSSDQPIIGATVMEIGSNNNGTVTAFDGSFTISVPRGASLRISYVGYQNVDVKAVEGRSMDILMTEDSELLEDVVVVGYGVQRKKLVTGSTVHVDADAIAAANAVDAFGALQSQAAGMNIVMNSGQPGESYKVTIRGMGTAGSNTPLYVIDGVPGGDISDLSPNDIESIDVLKDAASSAIYGARASNGVILVTTKKGKAGKVKVSFDGYLAWQNPNTNDVTPLNAKQYMEINDKAYEIQGVSKYDWATLIPKQYAQIMNGTWNGTNWLDETTIENAPMNNASLNITGGSDVSRFALGFTKFHQTEVRPLYRSTQLRLFHHQEERTRYPEIRRERHFLGHREERYLHRWHLWQQYPQPACHVAAAPGIQRQRRTL